jgi:undecaprenyl-diphosphatase
LILRDWFSALLTRQQTRNSRLGWAVLWGTIPTGIAGLLLHDVVATHLRSPLVIASTTIIFGLVLWYADARASRQRDEYSLNWKDILVIGCAQSLAIIPGTSRSGITISAGLILGLDRTAAARFSFLLSIPIIILAGGYEAKKLLGTGIGAEWSGILLMVGLSALSAYLCIRVFLKLIEQMGMLPFVIYRMLLGAMLFYLFI